MVVFNVLVTSYKELQKLCIYTLWISDIVEVLNGSGVSAFIVYALYKWHK